MGQLELIETDLEYGYRKISVVGELDLAVVGQLEEAIGRAAGAVGLLIDLSSCDFIDSMTIALFLRTNRKRNEKGQRFALVGPHEQVARVLGLTGLSENGLVFPSVSAALAALEANDSADAF